MKQKSVMTHQFSQVPQANIPRSQFNRSHGYKTTFNSGYLVPVYIDEALPGDTFNLKMTSFSRLATPIFPLMDNMFLDSFWFAVPIRLIWSNWQKFNGEQANPGDSTSYVVPTIPAPASTGYVESTLGDYFGIPTKKTGFSTISLFHRAYNLIWNEWFRDQNLQNSVTVDKGDGPDTVANYVLLKRGKRHDYFTSALPWPQKGTAVQLPLGTTAPVMGIGFVNQVYPDGPVSSYETGHGNTPTNYTFAKAIGTSISSANEQMYVNGDAATTGHPQIYADLSSATAATINQLRQAFQIQRMYERDARGGTRYTEILRSHFGVTSPDARLQRPELLGTGSSPININPVAQTSSTDSTTPQGNLAAFGTCVQRGHGFTKSFVEHCVIIGMVSARADLNYQQGLNRMFSRSTRFDFYWPSLAHLGEQSILNQEIYLNADSNDPLVFGYQERYAEYRYKPSQITGLFRSNATGTLEAWHLAQNFGSLPALNSTFIQETPPMTRVKAVSAAPDFIFDAYINLITARPMPTYSVPGMIDHL